MKSYIFIVVTTTYCWGLFLGYNTGSTSQPEYKLNLLDQNTVEIKARDTGKTYYCPLNKIDSVLILDNL